jgi:hypothetical protein
MSVVLEIEDGNPYWYLSPDIWTVPGIDPEGAPGQPIAGTSCFLWARVHNTGSTAVQDATVRFYWGNPSVGFDRSSATAIGTSFVSLEAGEAQDVLCLTPWIPSYVNGGHECVLAEAFHPSDPLSAGLAFNVPTDRHVAQRNLSVLMASSTQKMRVHLAFEIHNTSRKARVFELSTQTGKLSDLKSLHRSFGKDFHWPKEDGRLEEVGFIQALCPGEEDWGKKKHVLERLEVPGNGRVGMTLVGKLHGPAAVINVVQKVDGQIVGGLSSLVISETEVQAAHCSQKGA